MVAPELVYLQLFILSRRSAATEFTLPKVDLERYTLFRTDENKSLCLDLSQQKEQEYFRLR